MYPDNHSIQMSQSGSLNFSNFSLKKKNETVTNMKNYNNFSASAEPKRYCLCMQLPFGGGGGGGGVKGGCY